MNAAAIASLLQAMADLVEATDADIYTDDPDFAPAVWNLRACASQAKAELEKAKQMNTSTKDGGTAFPMQDPQAVGGMSLRDYFAAKAMQGFLSGHIAHHGHESHWPYVALASEAYELADAMLKAREGGAA